VGTRETSPERGILNDFDTTMNNTISNFSTPSTLAHTGAMMRTILVIV
jgi:hypothetical protein